MEGRSRPRGDPAAGPAVVQTPWNPRRRGRGVPGPGKAQGNPRMGEAQIGFRGGPDLRDAALQVKEWSSLRGEPRTGAGEAQVQVQRRSRPREVQGKCSPRRGPGRVETQRGTR